MKFKSTRAIEAIIDYLGVSLIDYPILGQASIYTSIHGAEQEKQMVRESEWRQMIKRLNALEKYLNVEFINKKDFYQKKKEVDTE